MHGSGALWAVIGATLAGFLGGWLAGKALAFNLIRRMIRRDAAAARRRILARAMDLAARSKKGRGNVRTIARS
jgi:hypothetical protein